MLHTEQIKNIVDYGVIGFLAFLSLIAFAFAIERILFYRHISLDQYKHPKELEIDLSRRLSTIASIGSSAPYIGLLGTVLAIMLTFYIMGDQGNTVATARIMKNLALALKATAAGLLVAIPATVIYNTLSTRADQLLAQWEILKDQGELKE
jgi:biopolymer transport protein ExbB